MLQSDLNYLKSLSPIYFVKILPPDFLCSEFLIKKTRQK